MARNMCIFVISNFKRLLAIGHLLFAFFNRDCKRVSRKQEANSKRQAAKKRKHETA